VDDLDDVATVLARAEEGERKSERVKGKVERGCSAKSTFVQDDLFSADGSLSPMKTPSNGRERTVEMMEPEMTALRCSPRQQSAIIASSPLNKVKRQQQSTATFMDEDGSLATKQVSEVIEGPERSTLPAPETHVKSLQSTKPNDANTKTEPESQTDISIFF